MNIKLLSTQSSSGVLSKFLYGIDGEVYLVKGNYNNCKEPFSEVLVSRYNNLLKNNHIEYTLGKSADFKEIKMNNGFEYVSMCKMHSRKMYKYYGIHETLSKKDNILETYDMLKLSTTHLMKMFLTDAAVGNCDRHLNNFDVEYNDEGKIVNSPMLDFGDSLLSNVVERKLKIIGGEKLGPDVSKPFKGTHKEQVRLLFKRYKQRIYFTCTDDIIDKLIESCSDIFELMTPKRAEAIKAYIRRRHEVYVTPYSINIPCKEVVIKDKEEEYELLANLLYNQKAVNKELYLEFTSKETKESILYHLEELRRSVLVKGVG